MKRNDIRAKLVCESLDEFNGRRGKRDQAYYDEFERRLRLMIDGMGSRFKSRIVLQPHAGVKGHVCWSLACDSDVNHSEDMTWAMIDATAGTVTVFSEGYEPYADVREADGWWGTADNALRYVDRDGNEVNITDDEFEEKLLGPGSYYDMPYFRVTGRITLDNMDEWKECMDNVIYEIDDDIDTMTGEEEDDD